MMEQEEEMEEEEMEGEETPEVEETTIIEEIKKLMVSTQKYSYLNCGRHLKDGITKTSLGLFYREFISYGASNRTDAQILKLLSKLKF